MELKKEFKNLDNKYNNSDEGYKKRLVEKLENMCNYLK